MITFTEQDNRREQFTRCGWNVAPPDDDVPTVPEPSPLSSAQHRRWWREHACCD
jgi:hypothetical protein